MQDHANYADAVMYTESQFGYDIAKGSVIGSQVHVGGLYYDLEILLQS